MARRSRTQGFSHVVRYGPRSALAAAPPILFVDSLLDASSHGSAGPAVPDALGGPYYDSFSGTTVMGFPSGTAGLKRP